MDLDVLRHVFLYNELQLSKKKTTVTTKTGLVTIFKHNVVCPNIDGNYMTTKLESAVSSIVYQHGS